jgi:hypothetical protein
VIGVDERGRHGLGPLIGGVLVAGVAGCAAGAAAGGIGLFTLFGEARLKDVAGFAVLVALLAAGSAGALVWAATARPGTASTTVVLAPFGLAWVSFVPWYRLRFPFWYIGWAAYGLLALAAATVWYGRGERRDPRRAVAYLVTVAAVVVVNGAGVAAVVWTNTNGFGLRGQPAPWTAFDALTRTSCLADYDSYRRGSRLVQAQCPSGPDADYYAGAYDVRGFDELLCSEQPRAAFDKWWKWNRELRIEFVLVFDYDTVTIDSREIDPPFPASAGGSEAMMVVTTQLTEVARSDTSIAQQARFLQAEETWIVRLETVPLGGWKVCRIDVTGPITVSGG